MLKVFPADAYAKLISAKYHIAQDDEDAARTALSEALDIWSGADENYVRLVEAKSLLASL